MLSRRCVRIKVMQLLFTLSRDEKLSLEEALRRYKETINDTFELFLLNLFVIQQIAEVSEDDEKKRGTKYLPSEEDKKFTAKLSKNPIVSSLRDNASLQRRYKQLGFVEKVDSDFVKKIYYEFSKDDICKDFVYGSENSVEAIEVLLELYRYCRRNEYFNELMEDNYSNWIDDKSVIVGSVKKSLKLLPSKDDFYEKFYPDEETVSEFGESLMVTAFNNDEEYLALIKPTLKNWDHDRLAVIDMILLKMAIGEMINFNTIPTKVTLNEYVEISKIYSTPKSKDFINGILDRLMKKLDAEGKIKKEGRGLVN